ncbi:GatB/YqeY domain-containing protein [Pseudophaeobacter arcticus]|jgi:uncharacterized protein YqeY|uniref:GatB/YqeY domain-containing protein n=1 Tax=Pseudophaeobacter arcticus TaxID=385492 RepID=UPI0039E5EA10
MDTQTLVNQALKQAMKDKEAQRISTLRLINAAIKDKEIAARGGDAETSIGDDEVLAILGKMTKQRNESARAYEEASRLDLAERELEEIAIIQEFLPKQLDDGEVRAAVKAAVTESGATSIRDMGKVMGALKAKFTGQMDFGKVGPMVKDELCKDGGC